MAVTLDSCDARDKAQLTGTSSNAENENFQSSPKDPAGRRGSKKKPLKRMSREKLEKIKDDYRKRGVVYVSRIPPHMKPNKVRQLLSQYGEVLRVYLAPEGSDARLRRKKAGGGRGKNFTEGWVEFAKKKVAKQVAQMLNGEQMGGGRRSSHFYDLWNIKYLHKFKWDNLTEEIAYRNAVKEQRLNAEVSVAKKERDFYLSRVDQSRMIEAITKRKRKRGDGGVEESGVTSPDEHLNPVRVVRHFSQRKAASDPAAEDKPRLKPSLLASVFGEGGLGKR